MKDWIEDEAEALKQAFRNSMASGNLFNVNSWKKKREKQRVLINKLKNEAKL